MSLSNALSSVTATLNSAARSVYDLSFQVSPIIFHNGIASGMPGNLLPVIALTGQVAALAQGALSGIINGSGLSLDDFYARYLPIPGGTVINQALGAYPFANQSVAANAIITQPKNISLMMIAPVRDMGGYLTKLALFTSLVTSFETHNQSGGTYHIATPSFIYTDCIMQGMTDITSGDTKQKQIMWQLDFAKPLVTMNDAAAAFSKQISALSGGQQIVSSAVSATTGAVASATQGITGMAGSVNTFLSSPISAATGKLL